MSYNQQRLRKLIGHVQHCMAEAKKQQSDHQFDQTQHLERINQQLQAYLLAQHQQYAKLQEQLRQNEGRSQAGAADPPVRPDPHLSDYLYARSLLAKHGLAGENQLPALPGSPAGAALPPMTDQMSSAAYGHGDAHNPQLSELYAEGVQEIFGKRGKLPALPPTPTNPLEINPLRIAYSKLPMALRNRRFGRPPLAPPAVTQPFRS